MESLGNHYIFDFDGTFTDGVVEGERYQRISTKLFAGLIGCTADQITTIAQLVADKRALVLAEPDKHFFMRSDGDKTSAEPIQSAPSVSDGMLLQERAIRLAIEELRGEKKDFALPEVNDLDDFTFKLYKESYPQVKTTLRAGAEKLLRRLAAGDIDYTIITNSSTKDVKRKIDEVFIDDELSSENFTIEGGAEKLNIDTSFDVKPQMLGSQDGFPYYLDLRRKKFDELIKKLKLEDKQIVTIGDIFPFDLVHPMLHHDAIGVLVKTEEYTPQWDIDFVRAHKKGMVIDSLTELDRVLAAMGVSFEI